MDEPSMDKPWWVGLLAKPPLNFPRGNTDETVNRFLYTVALDMFPLTTEPGGWEPPFKPRRPGPAFSKARTLNFVTKPAAAASNAQEEAVTDMCANFTPTITVEDITEWIDIRYDVYLNTGNCGYTELISTIEDDARFSKDEYESEEHSYQGDRSEKIRLARIDYLKRGVLTSETGEHVSVECKLETCVNEWDRNLRDTGKEGFSMDQIMARLFVVQKGLYQLLAIMQKHRSSVLLPRVLHIDAHISEHVRKVARISVGDNRITEYQDAHNIARLVARIPVTGMYVDDLIEVNVEQRAYQKGNNLHLDVHFNPGGTTCLAKYIDKHWCFTAGEAEASFFLRPQDYALDPFKLHVTVGPIKSLAKVDELISAVIKGLEIYEPRRLEIAPLGKLANGKDYKGYDCNIASWSLSKHQFGSDAPWETCQGIRTAVRHQAFADATFKTLDGDERTIDGQPFLNPEKSWSELLLAMGGDGKSAFGKFTVGGNPLNVRLHLTDYKKKLVPIPVDPETGKTASYGGVSWETICQKMCRDHDRVFDMDIRQFFHAQPGCAVMLKDSPERRYTIARRFTHQKCAKVWIDAAKLASIAQKELFETNLVERFPTAEVLEFRDPVIFQSGAGKRTLCVVVLFQHFEAVGVLTDEILQRHSFCGEGGIPKQYELSSGLCSLYDDAAKVLKMAPISELILLTGPQLSRGQIYVHYAALPFDAVLPSTESSANVSKDVAQIIFGTKPEDIKLLRRNRFPVVLERRGREKGGNSFLSGGAVVSDNTFAVHGAGPDEQGQKLAELLGHNKAVATAVQETSKYVRSLIETYKNGKFLAENRSYYKQWEEILKIPRDLVKRYHIYAQEAAGSDLIDFGSGDEADDADESDDGSVEYVETVTTNKRKIKTGFIDLCAAMGSLNTGRL
jgi:hypothetical protein